MQHLLYFSEVRAGRRGFREGRRPAGGFARNKKEKSLAGRRATRPTFLKHLSKNSRKMEEAEIDAP
jgi:hypothetical protein